MEVVVRLSAPPRSDESGDARALSRCRSGQIAALARASGLRAYPVRELHRRRQSLSATRLRRRMRKPTVIAAAPVPPSGSNHGVAISGVFAATGPRADPHTPRPKVDSYSVSFAAVKRRVVAAMFGRAGQLPRGRG